MMDPQEQARLKREKIRVRRRRTFYIHGFDPRSARTYYRLYREQAETYARRFDVKVDVGPLERRDDGSGEWTVDACFSNGPVHCDYAFMNWGDLASKPLRRGFWPTLGQGAWYLIEMARTGQLLNLWRANRRSALLIFYPHLMILALSLVSALLGLLAYLAAAAAGAPSALAVGAGALVGFGAFRLSRLSDRKFYAFYTLTMLAETLRQARGERPENEARLDEFARRIVAAAEPVEDTDAYDEVLVVGHSIGAYHAVAAVARALRMLGPDARLSLATLGQNIAFVSFHPDAAEPRREVGAVAADPRVAWVDVSGPNDLLTLLWLDVAAAPDVPGAERAYGPHVISNRPGRTLAAEDRRRRWLDAFRRHFLYLYANAKPGPWDWLLATAGPKTLWSRCGRRRRAPDADRLARPDVYKPPKRPG